MISYEIDIGFAIRRLISVFYEVACRITGDPVRVHFSFGRIGTQRCTALPAGFCNLLEFNYNAYAHDDLKRLTEYIRANDIGVILALDLSANARWPAAARRAGARMVISYVGAPVSSANSGLKLLMKRLEVALLRRAKPDHFIFESEAMRRLGTHGRGLSVDCTSVIHTGVDVALFRPNAADKNIVYERFGIPADRRIIVFMGHLHRRKGVHVLLQAAEHVVAGRGRRDIHFLFLGNRDGEAERFSGCFDKAAPFITIGGYHPDVPALLAGCYAGCIPSDGWDSFPMSSLEMQAAGLPVFASDCQGVPETVVDGVTGIVTVAGDAEMLARAIVELVDDPERRERMAIQARQHIEAAFTREHQIDNLVLEITRRIRSTEQALPTSDVELQPARTDELSV